MNAKQVKWLVLAVVVVLATITGVLAATSGRADSSASDAVVTMTVTVPAPTDVYGKPTDVYTPPPSTEAPASGPTESSTSSAPPPDPGVRAPTNVPMTKLKPGDTAPQFIIFSFDGAGNSAKMHQFMDAAKASKARFTGFLSGVYLLTDDHRDSYQAPGANRGSSQVGFGGDAAEVTQRISDLNEMYLMGNEIGTHYNGHFCALGLNWSTSEWNSELDQFFDFMTNWKSIDGLGSAPDLVFPPSEVKGGRTPCLNHQLNQIVPSWQQHEMTYDSSQPAKYDGIYWPDQIDGVWEFYMPQVYSAGLGGKVTAMDYNFWVKFNGAAKDVDVAAELTPKVLDTYRYMYTQAYNGNRAPILIANHFNDWGGNAFNPATEQFMREACVKPDTYCATYQDVIAWMQLQDPAVLAELQNQPSVAYQP